MAASLQPIADVDVGDRPGEEGQGDRQCDDVEHGWSPKRRPSPQGAPDARINSRWVRGRLAYKSHIRGPRRAPQVPRAFRRRFTNRASARTAAIVMPIS